MVSVRLYTSTEYRRSLFIASISDKHECDMSLGEECAQGWLEFAGLENDGVEQEQTYILHTMKNFNVYDM